MKFTRLLVVILSLLLLLGVTTAFAADSYDAVVYLDAAAGDDANDGLAEATAVKTIGQAYAVAFGQMKDAGKNTSSGQAKIVLVSDYIYQASGTKDIASSTYVHNYMLTITGKTPQTALIFQQTAQSYVGLIGPTTFEYMTIKLADTDSVGYLSLHSRGSKLIIGEGVSGGEAYNKCLSLSAGTYYKRTGDMYLEINSGKWRTVYAGGYVKEMTGVGNLVFNGGDCEKIATTFNGTHNGNANITINGGYVGQVQGGAANANGNVNGNVTITVNGGTVNTAFSACGVKAVNGTTTVNLQGGTINCSVTGGDTVNASGDLTLNGNSFTVKDFTGGGKLTLSPYTELTITGTVSGTTAFTVTGEPSYGTNYISYPATYGDQVFTCDNSALTFTTSGSNKVWTCEDIAYMKGLVLTAPKDVTVKLYTGIAKGATTLVSPNFTETVDGITAHYFLSLAPGGYHYVSSGTGYFTVDKDINFTAEKAAKKTVVIADPGKKSGNYYEAVNTLYSPTEEFLANAVPSDVSMWPEYAAALTTPMFVKNPNRAAQQYTTYDEMMDVVEEVVAGSENAYLYFLGKTGMYDLDIPLVIFSTTDLTGCKTLEDAAAAIRNNGKLTVHYQGQMHGNEPAGGEGALGVTKLLGGSYGEGLIDNMNIYVIPWMSPAGAHDDRRMIPGTDIDPNRDMLRVETEEMRLHHLAYELFQPEVSLDSHEFTVDPSSETTAYNDMMLAAGFTTHNSETFREMSIHLTTLPFEKLSEQGLRGTYYLDTANFNNPNNGSSYAGNRGILYVLIESRGIYGGHDAYARRVVGHVITATEVLDYVHENVEAVQKIVDDEKARLAELGATYEETDIVVLEHGDVVHEELSYVKPRFNGLTGEKVSQSTVNPKIAEEVVRSRVKPTAYVIPAGQSWTKGVLERLDKHFVEYEFIHAGQAIWLQQYGGTDTEATLSAEQMFTFDQGAYVVTMDTYYSVVIATMFEPDITDSYEYKGTLVQSGLIPAEGDAYPLYRYVRDLNEDGSITTYTPAAAPADLVVVNPANPGAFGAIRGLDANASYEYRRSTETGYTAVPAGATEITGLGIGTYYVRFCAETNGIPSKDAEVTLSFDDLEMYAVYLAPDGSDDAEGYTPETAVATFRAAISRLEQLLSDAPAGTEGYVILTKDFDLGSKSFTFPTHTFPLVITATDPSIALIKSGGTAQDDCYVHLSSPTTIDNITLKITSSSTYNNFNANGHKTVIGKGVTCVANSKGQYYMLAAGGSTTKASTNLTVLAGTWKNIYFGGYTGVVNGDCYVCVENCTVTDQFQASYNGAIGGNITAILKNVTTPAIYCGNANKNDVAGNVDITLTDCNITAFYAGSRDAGNVAGTVTVYLEGEKNGKFTTLNGQCKTKGTVAKSVLVVRGNLDGTPVNFTEVDYYSATVYLYVGKNLVETYNTFAEAAEAAAELEGSFLRLGSDVTETATIPGGILVDLAGYSISGITVDGVIYGMDSTTDGYEGDRVGTMTLAGGTVATNVKTTVAQTGAVRRYLAIPEGDGYTFHRFYSAITHITLNTTSGGIGYKATFAGDEAVQAYVAGFGLKLALTEDFQGVTEAVFTEFDGKVVTKTVLLEGIFKEGLTDAELAERAAMVIYAAAFITTEDGETITSSVEANSLQTMVETIDSIWNTLDVLQQKKLTAFYATYQDILGKWELHF